MTDNQSLAALHHRAGKPLERDVRAGRRLDSGAPGLRCGGQRTAARRFSMRRSSVTIALGSDAKSQTDRPPSSPASRDQASRLDPRVRWPDSHPSPNCFSVSRPIWRWSVLYDADAHTIGPQATLIVGHGNVRSFGDDRAGDRRERRHRLGDRTQRIGGAGGAAGGVGVERRETDGVSSKAWVARGMSPCPAIYRQRAPRSTSWSRQQSRRLARPARHPRQQRRRHPRQPRDADEGRGVGPTSSASTSRRRSG